MEYSLRFWYWGLCPRGRQGEANRKSQEKERSWLGEFWDIPDAGNRYGTKK